MTPACPAPVTTIERTVQLCGLLDDEMEAKFAQLPAGTYDTVIVTSNGGFAVNAVGIVRKINSDHARVEIAKYCYSACSNIVIMGAGDLTIDSHAVVSFHHSSTFIYMDYEFEKGVRPADGVKVQSAAELDFYKSRNLRRIFLYQIAYSLTPVCVGWNKNVPGNLFMRSEVDEVVPTRTEIEKVRGAFSGYWPVTLADAVADRQVANLLFQGKAVRFGLRPGDARFVPLCPESSTSTP